MDSYERVAEDSLRREDIDTTPDEGKLAELMLLVAEALGSDRAGGATKVYKVMYFAEFAHVRRTGRPITGVRYRKLRFGPVPRAGQAAGEHLVRSGDAEVVEEDFLGRPQQRLRPRREARRDLFTETELKAVDDAVTLLKGKTGRFASDLSHEEPGWRMVADGEDIPFVTAFLPKRQPPPPPRVRARMRALADKYGARASE